MHFTQLPIHVHEEIIALTDLRAWCLVSRQFLELAYTPWVKTEWLAQQPLLWRGSHDSCRTRRTDESSWKNAFGDHRLGSPEPQSRAYLKVPAPHNSNFFDLDVLRMLRSRYPRRFFHLRAGVLMHVAFWYKEEETIFMIEQGAPVDYANGWVLARFSCRPDAYHRAMIGDLIHRYGASVYPSCNRHEYNVLTAVLLQHNDCGDLAKYLVTCDEAEQLLDYRGENIVFRAIECDNLEATRFLLAFDRESRKFNTIYKQKLWMHYKQKLWMHAHRCNCSTGLMKMLVEEFGVEKERSVKLMAAYISARIHGQDEMNNSDACDQKTQELWDWLWGDDFTFTEDYLYVCMDMPGLYRHVFQSAPPIISWKRVMLLAIGETNIPKARVLIDSGLCSVHSDAVDTLRQLWASETFPCEDWWDNTLEGFIPFLVNRGVAVNAATDKVILPELRRAYGMLAVYLRVVGAKKTKPPPAPWKLILTDALRNHWKIVLLPLPYIPDKYFDHKVAELAKRDKDEDDFFDPVRLKEYEANERAISYMEAIFVIVEDRLSGEVECQARVKGKVLSKGRFNGVDIVWEHPWMFE